MPERNQAMKKLSPTELMSAARAVARKTYSPYSKFPVGAAVMTSDGEVFVGTNVENASYGLTICAERAAIFSMIAGGKKSIAALAIWMPTRGRRLGNSAMPCGACRQVISEFAKPSTQIYVLGSKSQTVRTLLPFAFRLKK